MAPGGREKGRDMSGFDLVFALLGLVLGLAITEVLAGFSRVIKMRGKAHVGWLTPLLGLMILLDLTSFWMQAYDLRDAIPANQLSLYVVMAIVGGYYLIATLIFPDDPDLWPDFDAYYDRYNRKILGGMLGINFATLLAGGLALALAPEKPGAVEEPLYLWSTIFELAPVPLIIALMIARPRWLNIVLLVALIGDFVAGAIADLL